MEFIVSRVRCTMDFLESLIISEDIGEEIQCRSYILGVKWMIKTLSVLA